MSKNNKKVEKEHLIKTKVKADNSIEVEIKKNPGKTTIGKIVAWLIIVGTLLGPLALLIYTLIDAIVK